MGLRKGEVCGVRLVRGVLMRVKIGAEVDVGVCLCW
jgi:hypothetical protein